MRTLLRTAVSLLAPPLCATCSVPCEAKSPICPRCRRALAAARGGAGDVPGLDAVIWSAPYAGVARDLVSALKFAGRVQLAAVAAEVMGSTLAPPLGATLIAVPAAPARHRARGFDPAHLIAAALADRLGMPLAQPLRRADGRRQVGRRRADRLADPPRVDCPCAAPDRVVLVDDVLTTGATLAACAAALRGAGGREISAAVFARALGARNAAA